MPKKFGESHQIARLSESLSIIAILVKILRERFSDTTSFPELPWKWKADPAETDIFIESGWNENLEARNVRPGIWVDRSQNVFHQAVIGDQDKEPVDVPTSLRRYYAIGEIDIEIDCTSPKRGESMILGSIVQDFLYMSMHTLLGTFGLRNFSPILLNKTTPFDKDNKLWSSVVTYRIEYELNWLIQPIARKLRSIVLELTENPEKEIRKILVDDVPKSS